MKHANTGRKFTEAHKNKIRLAHIGMKHTPETRIKISKNRQGKAIGPTRFRLGRKGAERTPFNDRALEAERTTWLAERQDAYTGGKWHYYKKQVLMRDDWTCQICKLRDVDIMEVDHLLPKKKYPELMYDMNNLRVLCPNCHRRKTNTELKNKTQ